MAPEKIPQDPGAKEPSLRSAPGETPDDAKTLTCGLLAHVLEQTVLESASDQSEASVSAAARAVGRKHVGSPFVLDPVLIELVEAMLLDQFQRSFPRENWRAVAWEVARGYSTIRNHRLGYINSGRDCR